MNEINFMKKFLLIVICFLFFDSCISYHNGFVAPNSVTVNSPNFKVIETIYGQAGATYFLGLGGTGKNGLIKEAKDYMYASYKLSDNQMITNITVDNKTSLFLGGIFAQHTTYISADVVEFSEKNNSTPNKSKTTNKTKNIKDENQNRDLTSLAGIKIGDYIYYKNTSGSMVKCLVKTKHFGINGNISFFTISYKNKKGSEKTVKLPVSSNGNFYYTDNSKYIKYK